MLHSIPAPLLSHNLTEKEAEMLLNIVNSYCADDNICYNEKLTPSEKGVVGSLVKKGLIYDSYNMDGYESNFFPSIVVMNAFGLEY